MANSTMFKKIIKNLYLLIIGIFLSSFFIKSKDNIFLYIKECNIVYLLTSISFIIFANIFLFIAYKNIQKTISNKKLKNIKISNLKWLHIFLYGYIGRYIPGKIAMIAGRTFSLNEYKLTKRESSIGVIYENIFLIISSILISIYSILKLYKIDITTEIFITLFIILLSASYLSLQIIKKTFNKIFKKYQISKYLILNKKLFIKSILYYSLFFIFLGAGFLFLISSITYIPITFSNLMNYTSINALGCSLGIIALFAPSGIGVREGLIVFLLVKNNLTPLNIAILSACIFRILLIIVEITSFITVSYLQKRLSNNSNPKLINSK